MAFNLPAWLHALRANAAVPGVRWFDEDTIRHAAAHSVPYQPPARVPLSPQHLAAATALWRNKVQVGEGPANTDRAGRVQPAQLWIDAEQPDQLLLALSADYPPFLWLPAGQDAAGLERLISHYFLSHTPPQAALPAQSRLFLATSGMLGTDFQGLETRLVLSPFCDGLQWGNTQESDPYPEQVTLGRIPVAELHQIIAQVPGTIPRTSIRTRHSRSIIRVADYYDAYFADLYYRPAPHADFTSAYNTRFGTDFHPDTPVDLVAALLGFGCIGAERIRAELATEPDPRQRAGMQAIVDILEKKEPA